MYKTNICIYNVIYNIFLKGKKKSKNISTCYYDVVNMIKMQHWIFVNGKVTENLSGLKKKR